jgi:uncharacterized protein (TIGR00297 family)
VYALRRDAPQREITLKLPARITDVAIGAAAASAIAVTARRVGWLTRDGAVAAACVGCATYAGTGIRGSVGLLAFFSTSSLLGKLSAPNLHAQRRGNERDAIQVLANGGIPAFLALAAMLFPTQTRALFLTGFGGAVAAATADTWATELGTRYGRDPRSILTLEPIASGTSGAVSTAGLLASAVGATLISALLAPSREGHRARQTCAIAAAGLTGALIDSLVGATWQEVRFCDVCQRETESPMHACGNRTRRLRGQAWCNNDVVNVIAVTSGALIAVAMQMLGTSPSACAADDDGLTRRAIGRVELSPRAMLGGQSTSISKGAST